MHKATKTSRKSPTKSKTEKKTTKSAKIDALEVEPNFEEDIEFFEDDLEIFEDDLVISPDEIEEKVDESFLLQVSNQSKIDAIIKNKQSSIIPNQQHPMDTYFKQLIKQVLVEEFLPLLEQTIKKQIKKE